MIIFSTETSKTNPKRTIFLFMVLKACNFRQLWHNNRVALQWVPNREGIEESEKVDKLAEEDAKTRIIRPISWCNLQNNDLKQVSEKWEDNRTTSDKQVLQILPG